MCMLEVLSPELFAQLHPTLNTFNISAQVPAFSKRKAWWVGECGHEWEASISNRSRGQSCPYCFGRKTLKGENDLATTHPELCLQWHPTKNVSLPSDYKAGSGRKVWWQCEVGLGHEWEATIKNRVLGRGCPYCANKKVLAGFNDLVATFPLLAAEWHPTKNFPHMPNDFSKGSTRKVWWQCKLKHEWEATIGHRSSGTGCPYCSGNKILSGFNDLSTTHPNLAQELDASKGYSAENVSKGQIEKVGWIGKCGHQWVAAISDRIAGDNCPVCSGQRVVSGINDFKTLYPELLKFWHPTKNEGLLPSQLSSKSSKKIWWQCEKNHEWLTSVGHISNGGRCRKCSLSARSSAAEKELYEYLSSLGLQVEASNTSALSPYEIDLFVNNLGLGIEFNGIYWHSEAGKKTFEYHHKKWKIAKDKGIQLIQIWEDDWNRNPELIKYMLAHKTNSFRAAGRTYARSTKVIQLPKIVAKIFLEENHIQGYASGTHYLGLSTQDGITIACLVLKVEKDSTFNIVRYATSAQVQGGFTKLLKYAERTYKPTKFVTFSDNCVSDGGLYEKNGFTATKQLPPDYMYVVKGERKHKFGYRLKKFKNDPNLLWEEGLTERELAQLNNLPRIWDAGKTKWEKVC